MKTKIELYFMSLGLLFGLLLIKAINIPICFDDNAQFIGWEKLKSSRLFPLSYLFQKNQYKYDIVPSLPTGLCGIEPIEHAPV